MTPEAANVLRRLARRSTYQPSGCITWNGSKAARGQGNIKVRVGDQTRTLLCHRAAYEAAVAPIPDGLTIDHLCMNPSCWNPAHLEPVTTQVNTRRWADTITHCPRGHEYTLETTRLHRLGYRSCRTCERDRAREASRAICSAAKAAGMTKVQYLAARREGRL